jgi:hypothetical protein
MLVSYEVIDKIKISVTFEKSMKMEKIVNFNGSINLLNFETDKGKFGFIEAQDGGRSIWETIDTIKNLTTGETTQHKRKTLKNYEAKRISR